MSHLNTIREMLKEAEIEFIERRVNEGVELEVETDDCVHYASVVFELGTDEKLVALRIESA